ncbi:MAG: AraC family transcriptional regulator [Clostridiaceae bacterium]
MTVSACINSNNFTHYQYFFPYIRYCAEDKYGAPWNLKNRIISDYEFIFITKGTGLFTIDGHSYHVKPNDLILIKPGKCHSGSSVSLPFYFLCIHFELYVSNDINDLRIFQNSLLESSPVGSLKFQKAAFDFPEATTVDDSGYILTLFKRIINESTQQQIGFAANIKSIFIEMLIRLFRQEHGGHEQKSCSPEIYSVINYIKQNYAKKINLSDLAIQAHLQPAYLSALFKKCTGCTITDYIRSYRISIAKDHLLETDWKIEDIACSAGFYDLHHFSKVFKIYEGLTPVQFRQIKR